VVVGLRPPSPPEEESSEVGDVVRVLRLYISDDARVDLWRLIGDCSNEVAELSGRTGRVGLGRLRKSDDVCSNDVAALEGRTGIAGLESVTESAEGEVDPSIKVDEREYL
jgi:hypothetical protein